MYRLKSTLSFGLRAQIWASLSREHPVSSSSRANTNVRSSQAHSAHDFRSVSFTECCPLCEAVFLCKIFRQHPFLLLTQTTLRLFCGCSWLTKFPLYTMLQLTFLSVPSLQSHALICIGLLLVSLPLTSVVFSCQLNSFALHTLCFCPQFYVR